MNRRSRRRWTVFTMLIALVWTQLAVAAYACPTLGDAPRAVAASPHDCEHDAGRALAADPEHPNLCLQKSLIGSQHCDAHLTLAVAPRLGSSLVVQRDDGVSLVMRPAPGDPERLAASGPPRAIAYCCFRI